MAYSLESFRDLNKIYIYLTESDPSADPNVRDNLFLYTNQGWDYQFNIDTSMAAIDGARNLIKNPILSIGWSALTKGASSVVDIQRKYVFSGSMPLTFTVEGFRYLENDLEGDILTPINTLLSWLLPKRGPSIWKEGADITEKIDVKTENKYSQGWDFIQKVLKNANNVIGDVSFLEIPEQFGLSTKRSMYVKIGGKVIKNVFLKSVAFKTPKFYYGDENGAPIPDRVDFTLTFETLRCAVRDDFKF